MRVVLSMCAVVAALAALPVVAQAEAFTFTPTDNSGALVFTATGTPDMYANGEGFRYAVTAANGDALQVAFLNTAFFSQMGSPIDFNLINNTTGVQYTVDGQQLYSGLEQAPVFTAGSYTLYDDPALGSGFGGTLSIAADSGSVAATPEPSTLMLLGSGILGVAGVARRRFVRA